MSVVATGVDFFVVTVMCFVVVIGVIGVFEGMTTLGSRFLVSLVEVIMKRMLLVADKFVHCINQFLVDPLHLSNVGGRISLGLLRLRLISSSEVAFVNVCAASSDITIVIESVLSVTTAETL